MDGRVKLRETASCQHKMIPVTRPPVTDATIGAATARSQATITECMPLSWLWTAMPRLVSTDINRA